MLRWNVLVRQVSAVVTRCWIRIVVVREFRFTKQHFGTSIEKEEITLEATVRDRKKTTDRSTHIVSPDAWPFDLVEFCQVIDIHQTFDFHLFAHGVQRTERGYAEEYSIS